MAKGLSQRGVLLLLAGTATFLAVIVGLIAWGFSVLVNRWTEARVQSWVQSSHLESQVSYRSANHELFSGATIIRDVQLRFDPTAAPLVLGEVRINRYAEQSSVPTAVDVSLNNIVFTPACLTDLNIKKSLLQLGIDKLSGNAHLSWSLDPSRKVFELTELRLTSGDQFDFQLRFQIDGIDFDKWKVFVQGTEKEVSTTQAQLQTLLESARLVSASGLLTYGNAVDFLADAASKASFGLLGNKAVLKEQWVESATQQIPANYPKYREAVAQMIRTPCRVIWESHPQQPIPFNGNAAAGTDWAALYNFKLDVTPINPGQKNS